MDVADLQGLHVPAAPGRPGAGRAAGAARRMRRPETPPREETPRRGSGQALAREIAAALASGRPGSRRSASGWPRTWSSPPTGSRAASPGAARSCSGCRRRPTGGSSRPRPPPRGRARRPLAALGRRRRASSRTSSARGRPGGTCARGRRPACSPRSTPRLRATSARPPRSSASPRRRCCAARRRFAAVPENRRAEILVAPAAACAESASADSPDARKPLRSTTDERAGFNRLGPLASPLHTDDGAGAGRHDQCAALEAAGGGRSPVSCSPWRRRRPWPRRRPTDRHAAAKVSARVREQLGDHAQTGRRRRDRPLPPGAGSERAGARCRRLGGRVRRQFRGSSRWMAVRLPARGGDGARREPRRRVRGERRAGVGGHGRGASGRERAAAASAREPAEGRRGDDRHAGLGRGAARRHPDPGGVRRLRGQPGERDRRPRPPGRSTRAESSSIDPNGHGTHVAGILVGNGSHSSEGRLAGIAPAANLVSVRVLDDGGQRAGRRTSWPACSGSSPTRTSSASVSSTCPSATPSTSRPRSTRSSRRSRRSGTPASSSCARRATRGRDGDGTITQPLQLARGDQRRGAATTAGRRTSRTTRWRPTRRAAPPRIDLVAKPDLLAPGNRIVSAARRRARTSTCWPRSGGWRATPLPGGHGVLRAVGHQHGGARWWPGRPR